MWGSDFPHPDGVWPDSTEVLAKELGHLPASVRHKIVCGNAGRSTASSQQDADKGPSASLRWPPLNVQSTPACDLGRRLASGPSRLACSASLGGHDSAAAPVMPEPAATNLHRFRL